MEFYAICYSAWFGGGISIFDDFDEYIRNFKLSLATISGGDIDTYKFRAWNEEEAYEKAKRHFREKGWDLQ